MKRSSKLLALVEHQAQQIEQLKTKIVQLKRQNERLETRPAKNSANRSKPLSSDGLNNPKSPREKGRGSHP